MIRTFLIGCVLCLSTRAALALDAFDRHTSFWLRTAVKGAKPLAEMSQKQAEELKRIDPSAQSPCVVVKTDEGNLAKALLSWGFRRGKDKVVPVLLIERYVTYTDGRADLTSAAGGNVMLFPGFAFNFDIGQVVPREHGADLEFTDKRNAASVGSAELYGMNGPVVPKGDDSGAHDPNDHEGVLPQDFSGNWRMNADGRWLSQLQISVDEEGTATGKYYSEETKSGYPVEGKMTKTIPHRITFVVDFGNSKQSYEAFLWTKDKSTMAGTVTVDTQRFGFTAERAKVLADGDKPKPSGDAKSP